MVTVIICDTDNDRGAELAQVINSFYQLHNNVPVKVRVVSQTRSRVMLVPTSAGEELIYIRNLNYINIEERSLCYHLSSGVLKASHVLRSSFEKSICQYLNNENLLFIKPSLLINVANIKVLDKDKITFKNDEILYYPKKHYELIKSKWGQ